MDTRNNPIIIDGDRTGFGARTTSTTSLLGRVLLITSVGFLTSAIGVAIAPPFMPQGATLICFLVTLGLIFAIRATRNTPALSFALFLLLTLAMGFEIAPWIQYLLHTPKGRAIVFNAALTTAVGMGAIGIGAQILSFDYRKLASFAFAALLALILVGVLSMFFHFVSPGLYAWASLAIFTMLLLVDFMRIKDASRDGGAGATAIELALTIYLDGLNIFLALTQIFSGGGRRR